MSNPISGNKVISFDFGTYIANNPSNNIKQLVEDVLLPQVQSVFPNAYYYSFPYGSGTTKYAFISVPWSDGTIDDRLFIGINKDETATIPTGYTDLGLFYGVPNTINVGGVITNGNNYLRYEGALRFLEYEGGYAVGWNSYSGRFRISCPALITQAKDNSGNLYNCVLTTGGSGNTHQVTPHINVGGNIVDRRYSGIYPASNTDGIGVLTPVDTGDYKIEGLYTYDFNYRSLKGVWETDQTLLDDEEYTTNMWYKNAFTIDNQSFDAWLFSNHGSGVGLCRKHIPDNPNV